MGIALVYCPQHNAYDEQDVDYDTRIERAAQHIDKEEFKPSAYCDDARHHAIEHDCHNDKRDGESRQRAFQVGFRMAFVVVNKHNCRDAQQVEEMDTDRQACHVCNEHKPAVGVRLVGMVFPFQNEPEDDGGEGRGIGIHLALDSREPECV